MTTGAAGAVAAGTPMSPRLAARADDTALVRVSNGPTSLSFSLPGASNAPGVAKANRVTYADALPGADLVYTVQRQAVEEEIVLKTAPTTAPSWTFPLAVDGLVPRTETNGVEPYGLYATNKIRFFVPPDAAMDASRNDATDSKVRTELVGNTQSGARRRVRPGVAVGESPRG